MNEITCLYPLGLVPFLFYELFRYHLWIFPGGGPEFQPALGHEAGDNREGDTFPTPQQVHRQYLSRLPEADEAAEILSGADRAPVDGEQEVAGLESAILRGTVGEDSAE